MRKPTASQVIKRNAYWTQTVPDNMFPKPEWTFDFVSVHLDFTGKYSLLSPMCLVRPTGERPVFEKEKFEKKSQAISRAKQIAKEHRLFTVDCV